MQASASQSTVQNLKQFPDKPPSTSGEAQNSPFREATECLCAKLTGHLVWIIDVLAQHAFDAVFERLFSLLLLCGHLADLVDIVQSDEHLARSALAEDTFGCSVRSEPHANRAATRTRYDRRSSVVAALVGDQKTCRLHEERHRNLDSGLIVLDELEELVFCPEAEKRVRDGRGLAGLTCVPLQVFVWVKKKEL